MTHAETTPPVIVRTRAAHVLVLAAVRVTLSAVVESHAVHAPPFSAIWTSYRSAQVLPFCHAAVIVVPDRERLKPVGGFGVV